MWRPRVPFQVDSAVGSAGLALVCSTLAQYFFTWEAEIYSEILCWVTLPALFIFTEKWDKWTLSKWTIVYSDGKPASSWSLWVVAFFLALQSLGKSQYGILVLFVSSHAQVIY